MIGDGYQHNIMTAKPEAGTMAATAAVAVVIVGTNTVVVGAAVAQGALLFCH